MIPWGKHFVFLSQEEALRLVCHFLAVFRYKLGQQVIVLTEKQAPVAELHMLKSYLKAKHHKFSLHKRSVDYHA